MSSFTILVILVSVICILFLAINFIFAPHTPYLEKNSAFECGFHSFLQTRSIFYISFFIYALLFLLFDLEILLMFPFAVSSFVNNIYGLIILLVFSLLVTLGFIYELGKGALKLPSKGTNLEATKINPAVYISSLGRK